MATLAERIVSGLAAQGIDWPGGPANAVIRRTRAGRHQRSAGAWSWFLWHVNDVEGALFPSVGSQWPASRIARGFVASHNKAFHSWDLDPPDA
jgi:hypothetical protein